ncbi:hypothetical protein CLIB1423_14S01420 [[Candida] railenensis]|uniref:SUN-like protein 1 n=1 Tax=[Candida] railenensis TaxID=45579 RepID=A0A9P0VYR5_9ASCO|nr:hypothetical protein CLIB1423_14S01420 [[Candida] railenensis]
MVGITDHLSSESIHLSPPISTTDEKPSTSELIVEIPTIVEVEEADEVITASESQVSEIFTSAPSSIEELRSSSEPTTSSSLVVPDVIINFNATDLNNLVNVNNSNSTEDLFLSFEEWKRIKEEDAASESTTTTYTSASSSAESDHERFPTEPSSSSSSSASSNTSATVLPSVSDSAPLSNPHSPQTDSPSSTLSSSDSTSLSPQLSSLLSVLDYTESSSEDSKFSPSSSSSTYTLETELEIEESTSSMASSSSSTSTESASPVATSSTSSIVSLESSQVPEADDAFEIDSGKVYKDKFNYASSDCAATIVKTNNNAKGASAILVENKDTYLLNQCSILNKFVVIELCQDILVDSVVLGNFEFFSSMFKNIKFSVSDRFPTQSWEVLGHFEAQNIRDLQTFSIENPLIWSRYLKIEILSHYGDEFYCPLSVVRVHGKTMMEEFKMAEEEEQQQLQQLQLQKQRELQEQEEVQRLQQEQHELELNVEQFRNISTPNTSEECAVVLPHLGLIEFLNDVNTTEIEDFCYALENETVVSSPSSGTEVSSSTQSPVSPSSSASTSASIEVKTTQESIYKNIMKRLSLLEANASISLLYIEEQSKLLSTAFSKLERRQSTNFQSLIDNLISTMTNQLNFFRDAYINTQHETSNVVKQIEKKNLNMLEDMSNKIIVLGNELRFQKRLALFNSIIILILVVYIILVKEIYIAPQESENPTARSNAKRIHLTRDGFSRLSTHKESNSKKKKKY